MKLGVPVVLGVAVVVSGACGGSYTTPPDPYAPLARYMASYCAKASACCSAAELWKFSYSDSEDSTVANCNQATGLGVAGAGVGSGRIRVNQAHANACAAAIDAASCAEFGQFIGAKHPEWVLPDCARAAIFEPLQEIGESCEYTDECQSQWCCMQYGGAVCKDPGTWDGWCATSWDCPWGRFCHEFVCYAPYANGHSCTSYGECDSGNCTNGVCTATGPAYCTGKADGGVDSGEGGTDASDGSRG